MDYQVNGTSQFNDLFSRNIQRARIIDYQVNMKQRNGQIDSQKFRILHAIQHSCTQFRAIARNGIATGNPSLNKQKYGLIHT